MSSLGTMSVAFTASTSGLESGIGRAQGLLGGFASGIASGISGLVNFGKTAIDVGMALLAPDAAMEQMSIGFTTLMHSASAAKQELAALNTFAAHTPFQVMDIDASGAKLLAFGEKATMVIPDLTAIGDTLSALGQTTPAKLQQVVAIFGKIDTTGKLTTGIMTQLSRNGINGWQALADATGKPISVLQEMVHKGLIPASEATADLRAGLEKMYGGGMLAQSQTFNGLMSTLKDNVLQAWRSISGPLFDAAKGALSWIGTIAGSSQFQNFATSIGTGITGMFKQLGPVFAGLGASFAPLFGMLHDLGTYVSHLDFGPFVASVRGLGTAFLNLLAPISGVTKSMPPGMWDNIQGAIQGFIHGGLTQLTGMFSGLTGIIKGVTPVVAGVVSQIGPVFSSLAKTVGPVFSQIGQTISGVFSAHIKTAIDIGTGLSKWFTTSLLPAIKGAMPGFQSLATTIMTTLVPGLLGLWAIGQSIVDKVMPPLVKMFEVAAPVVVRLSGFIAEGLSQAIKFLAPYVLQAATAVAQFAGDIATRVLPIVTQFWQNISKGLDWLQTNWKYIWPSLSQILKGAWDIIVGVVKIAWATLSGLIKIGLDILGGNWKQAWTDFKTMLSGIWSGIQSIVKGQIETLKGVFTGLATLAIGWGQNLIHGFVSGIENSIGSIGSALSGVAHEVAQWLPQSPAKKGELSHLNEYGPALMRGFSQGIINSKPMITQAMNLAVSPFATLDVSHYSQAAVGASAGGSSGGGSNRPIEVAIYFDKRQVARQLGPALVDEMKLHVHLR